MDAPKPTAISLGNLPLTYYSNMDAFYNKKNILLTGSTGFVGKVILEKILRDLPDVGAVYLFVRPKKDTPPNERLVKQILNSRIFDLLRKKRTNFDEWVKKKIILIEGDLTAHALGLSESDKKLIRDNVNIFIHCAATLDFDEPLDRALLHNVQATLELFQLAKECKSLSAFTHVSTAYVASNLQGHVKERLIPMRETDPERTYLRLSQLTPNELQKRCPQILKAHGYPNTYTYTKCLTEHLLVKRREKVPLIIMRPTIIGSAYREPVEGWIDAVMAASAIYLGGGLGFLKFLPGRMELVGDQVPVDIVSNAILACSCLNANIDQYNIYHVGTSARNPLTWRKTLQVILPYWAHFPPKRAVAKPKFNFIPHNASYQIQHMIRFKLPIVAYGLYAESFLGTEAQKKKAALLKKLSDKQTRSVKQLAHFTSNEWVFDDTNMQIAMQVLTKEDREKFQFDVSVIHWDPYLRAFCWGLRTFVLKEDAEHPSQLNVDWNDLRLQVEKEMEASGSTKGIAQQLSKL